MEPAITDNIGFTLAGKMGEKLTDCHLGAVVTDRCSWGRPASRSEATVTASGRGHVDTPTRAQVQVAGGRTPGMAPIPSPARDRLTTEPLVAHLATCHDGRPHAAPVWFHVRDDAIEIATTGRKLTNIREDPRVALSIERTEDSEPQWGMTVRGTATVVESESEAISHRLNAKYGADEGTWTYD